MTHTLAPKRRPAFAATPLGYLYAVAAVPADAEDDFYAGEVVGFVYRRDPRLWEAYRGDGGELELVGQRSTRELAGQALLRRAG